MGVAGGFGDMLVGDDDELRVNLFDRGYKFFFPIGAGVVSFPAWCNDIEQQNNGRVIARFPLDPGDDWYDEVGIPHPPPDKPPYMQAINLMHEVVANSSRLFNLSHR